MTCCSVVYDSQDNEYFSPTPKLSSRLSSERRTLWRHFWSYCRVTKSLPSLFVMPDGLVLESEEKLRAHFWHTGTVDPRSDWTTRQNRVFTLSIDRTAAVGPSHGYCCCCCGCCCGCCSLSWLNIVEFGPQSVGGRYETCVTFHIPPLMSKKDDSYTVRGDEDGIFIDAASLLPCSKLSRSLTRTDLAKMPILRINSYS